MKVEGKILSTDQEVKRRIEEAISEKIFPGCVVGVVDGSGNRQIISCGRHTYEPNSTELSADSIFDIASVTKSIPTSCALLTLVEQGYVHLDDPIVKFIPEFDTESVKRAVLVRHLLTYSLDLGPLSLSGLVEAGKSGEEILETIFSAPLARPPGERYVYANSTGLLAGLLVERASGQKLPQLAQEFFFDPLRMTGTTFAPGTLPQERIVPTGFQGGRGDIRAIVHDPGTFVLQPRYILGSAGLFSTVPDLLNFLEMILREGEMEGRRFFKPEIIRDMYTNQLAGTNYFQGLGWQLNNPVWMGTATPTLFGKTGFTGCMVLMDPHKKRGLVALSNRTYPQSPSSHTGIHVFWRKLADFFFKI